jgi:transcriptional regulator with XRE-family HTH domain
VELRERFGWSQRELGRRSGIRPQRLSRLEHGDRSPRFEELLLLQQALEVSFDQLLSGQASEVSLARPARPDSPEWVGRCLIAAGQKLLESWEETTPPAKREAAP